VKEILYLMISANFRRLDRLEKLMSFNEVLYLMISANLRCLEKLMSFSELWGNPFPDDFSKLAALGETDELLRVVKEVLNQMISANLPPLREIYELLRVVKEILYLIISASLCRLEKLMSFSEL
jgi:hypothetical protein